METDFVVSKIHFVSNIYKRKCSDPMLCVLKDFNTDTAAWRLKEIWQQWKLAKTIQCFSRVFTHTKKPN